MKGKDESGPPGEGLAESGRGLGLLSLFVGLSTGTAAYWIIENWIDITASPTPQSVAILQSIVAFSAGWLLLSERRDFIRPIVPAALIAGLLAVPTWNLAAADQANGHDIDPFPFIFWFAASAPLAFHLMLSLAKAALETGRAPKYPALFFHGLTLPLIGGGAALFAGLSLVLLFAWAALLKQMDVAFFAELFDQPWFIMPFLGAIGGLSIAMIRGQQAVLGALRFMLLLFSRIAMPIMALFSLTFLAVLATKGPGAILGSEFFFDRPGGVILFLAFAGMLFFNGVYQNGEGAPPPSWLRVVTLISIASFPVYTGLASYALWLRIAEYGLTPPRIGGLTMTALAFAYSIVLIAGLLTELNWRGRRWMPLVAPMNVLMAALWIFVLLAFSSPLFNSWKLSAESQERKLVAGEIAPGDFDYGYLKFRLGEEGGAALARLENLRDHPAAAEIRAGVRRARDAQTYWEYQHPEIAAPTSSDGQAPPPGPLELEFNPADAPPMETAPDGEG